MNYSPSWEKHLSDTTLQLEWQDSCTLFHLWVRNAELSQVKAEIFFLLLVWPQRNWSTQWTYWESQKTCCDSVLCCSPINWSHLVCFNLRTGDSKERESSRELFEWIRRVKSSFPSVVNEWLGGLKNHWQRYLQELIFNRNL